MVAIQSRELARRLEETKRASIIQTSSRENFLSSHEMNSALAAHWDITMVNSDNRFYISADGATLPSHVGNGFFGGPHRLHGLLQQQKKECAKTLVLKQTLLDLYNQELQKKDENFVKELKVQIVEVEMLLQRMLQQHQELGLTFAHELENVERAFMQERNALLSTNNGETDRTIESLEKNESNFFDMNTIRLDEHLGLLEEARVKDAEEYNLCKIKLETDVQVLEQQLQQIRATYQLNNEKLEYNFQVLKKRDDENNVTVTTQKRKANRLGDFVNTLRIKLSKKEEQHQKSFNQLSEEYRRISEQFKVLQIKFSRFQQSDKKKYMDIWDMNQEAIEEQLRKVLAADQVIWEGQLGCSWKCPDEISAWLNRTLVVRETSSNHNHHDDSPDSSIIPTNPSASTANALSRPQFQDLKRLFTSEHTRKIISLLTDEMSPFLVEEKLQKLLAPLGKDEQDLMRLDTIFKALSIETAADVRKLELYFIKHESRAKVGDEGQLSENDASAVELIHPNQVKQAVRKFLADNRQTHTKLDYKHDSDGLRDSIEENGVDSADEPTTNAHRITQDRKLHWKSLSALLEPKKFHVWNVGGTACFFSPFSDCSHIVD